MKQGKRSAYSLGKMILQKDIEKQKTGEDADYDMNIFMLAAERLFLEKDIKKLQEKVIGQTGQTVIRSGAANILGGGASLAFQSWLGIIASVGYTLYEGYKTGVSAGELLTKENRRDYLKKQIKKVGLNTDSHETQALVVAGFGKDLNELENKLFGYMNQTNGVQQRLDYMNQIESIQQRLGVLESAKSTGMIPAIYGTFTGISQSHIEQMHENLDSIKNSNLMTIVEFLDKTFGDSKAIDLYDKARRTKNLVYVDTRNSVGAVLTVRMDYNALKYKYLFS